MHDVAAFELHGSASRPSSTTDSGGTTGRCTPWAASWRPVSTRPSGPLAVGLFSRRAIGPPSQIVVMRYARVGGELGHPDGGGRQRLRRGELGVGDQPAPAVGRQHAVHDGVLVGVVDAHDVAVVQQVAVLLVPRHPPGQLVELAVVEPEQVPLDPEVAEQRRRRPELERLGAPGRVGVRRADVAPHHRRWHQRRGVALDDLALERVVAVARPHPLGPGEDAEVDPRPARRAALDLDVGVACAQLVEQRVQGERLGVGAGPAGRRGGLHVVAVHVPLDEGDVVVAEQRVEATEHLGVGGGVGEVEHELVAGEHRLVAGVDQRPLRMGAVEVAVGVDHLRLDPDPELHAERPDALDQRRQTVGMGVR